MIRKAIEIEPFATSASLENLTTVLQGYFQERCLISELIKLINLIKFAY